MQGCRRIAETDGDRMTYHFSVRRYSELRQGQEVQVGRMRQPLIDGLLSTGNE